MQCTFSSSSRIVQRTRDSLFDTLGAKVQHCEAVCTPIITITHYRISYPSLVGGLFLIAELMTVFGLPERLRRYVRNRIP